MAKKIDEKSKFDGMEVLTIEEAAKYLRMHANTLRRLAKEHRFPAHKLGYVWRVRKDAIDAFLHA